MVLQMLIHTQKTSQNADDVEVLRKRIDSLTEMLQKVTTGGVSPSQPMRDRIQRLSEYVRHPNSPEVAYRNECQCMDQIRSRCQGDRIAQLCKASGQSRQRCSHNCGRNGGRHLVHSYIHGKRTRCTRTYCNRWLIYQVESVLAIEFALDVRPRLDVFLLYHLIP